MNLKQAYEGWGQQSQNRELYLKTKEAFRKAWFLLPTNKPCSWYTKRILALALAETKVVYSDKVRATSVLIQALDWANFAEPNFNPKPDFTIDDITAYSKLPKDELDKVKEQEDYDLDIDPVTGEKKAVTTNGESSIEQTKDEVVVRVKPEALEKRKKEIAERNKDIVSAFTDKEMAENVKQIAEAIKNNEDMNTRGMQPKACVQIDMQTLKPIKTWRSIFEAQKELGVRNISRAIDRRGVAGGYYWCNAGEEADFKPNKASAVQVVAEAKKKEKKPVTKKKSVSEVNVPNITTAPPQYKPYAILPNGCVVMQERAGISTFSNDELIAEMKRRGWKGQITMTVNIEL